MRRNRDYAPAYDDPDVEEKFTTFLLSACADFTTDTNHEGPWRDAHISFEGDSKI
jgi:hypothetical protein